MQVDSNLKSVTDNLILADTSTFVKSFPIIENQESFITESSPTNFSISIKDKNNEDWISILLLLGFVLLAISKFIFRKRFNDFFKAFWARNYSNQLMREGNIFKEQFGLLMFLLYLISVPLFYSISLIYLLPTYESKLSLVLVTQIVILFLILWSYRVLFIKITSFIFKTPKPSAEILTQLFIFNLISAVAVLPFITLFYYSEFTVFLIIGIIIWSLIQIYRFIRLFIIGFSYSIFSGLHLFLYLCTLEIVPIIILIKIVNNFYQ